jgi:DNA polymerase-2
MKGIIVDTDFKNEETKTIVYLYGKLENSESFVTINEMNPYFFIKKEEQKKVRNFLKDCKIEETKLKTFQEEELIKIICNNQTELNKLQEEIHKETETFEADIKPDKRFLLDNNINSYIEIKGDYEFSEKINRIYNNPEIKSIKPEKIDLKIASIDIETDGEEVFCISIYTKKEKRIFMITNHKIQNVTNCKNEFDCLSKFNEEIKKIDPDVITGWNLIDFDLNHLKKRMDEHKILFDLGRTNEPLRLRIEKNFFRNSSANATGRQILDALNLIKDPFVSNSPKIKNLNFESYTLENVAQVLLKRGKSIKGIDRHEEISSQYKKNTLESHKKIAEYNLLDSELVYEILERTEIIELAVERSALTGMTLNKISSSIASLDNLYIKKARERNLVVPTTHFTKKEEKIRGGFVSSLKPGIYHNVLIFDFKSLYPSIIRTFNIDPSSYSERKIKDSIESPNKAYFKNQNGILPEIIDELHQAREKAKKEKRELASYGIKIIMNSFFGVLASPNCRFFNLNIANAITYFGQEIIKLTAKEIEKLGYKTIYSDTDSVFVETSLEKSKANNLGKEIESTINKFYENYTKENYKRKSFLELEFEKQYISLIIPKIRDIKSEKAAKKRYAGLVEKNGKEEIEITGLEAIRGDWTEAAKEFQIELLNKVFHNEETSKFIKEYIAKLRAGKMDEKLVYKKSIRKNLEDYTKTTPPHVKAARKLPQPITSNIIQYYQTTDGPEPIENLKHKIDYEHYIEKQIQPIANQILLLLNKNFEDVEKGTKQQKLF